MRRSKSKSPIYLIRRGRKRQEDQRGIRGRGNKSRDSRSSSSSTGSNDRSGRRSKTRMEKQSRRYSKGYSRSSERLHGRIPRRLRADSRSLSRGRRSSSSSPDRRISSRRYSRDHSSEKRSLRGTSSNSEEVQCLWSKALQKAESSKTTLGQDVQKGKSPRSASTAGKKLKPKKSSGKMLSNPENSDPVEIISDKSEEETMLKIMGFSGFDSTKGKFVEGNDTSGLPSPVTTRKYRQYMNRKGGFNRPLDFTN